MILQYNCINKLDILWKCQLLVTRFRSILNWSPREICNCMSNFFHIQNTLDISNSHIIQSNFYQTMPLLSTPNLTPKNILWVWSCYVAWMSGILWQEVIILLFACNDVMSHLFPHVVIANRCKALWFTPQQQCSTLNGHFPPFPHSQMIVPPSLHLQASSKTVSVVMTTNNKWLWPQCLR